MEPLTPVPAQLLTNTAPAARVTGAAGEKDLRAKCADFEALFINQLLQTMRKGVLKSGLLDGGLQENIYTGMFDEQVAADIARGKGIGLGELLYTQLVKTRGSEPAIGTTRMPGNR